MVQTGYLPSPHPLTDRHQNFHGVSCGGRNHVCQLPSLSFQGFRGGNSPKIGLVHSQRTSPLQQLRTNVLHCDISCTGSWTLDRVAHSSTNRAPHRVTSMIKATKPNSHHSTTIVHLTCLMPLLYPVKWNALYFSAPQHENRNIPRHTWAQCGLQICQIWVQSNIYYVGNIAVFLSLGFTNRREFLHGGSVTTQTSFLPFWGDSPRDGRVLGVHRGHMVGYASCWSTCFFFLYKIQFQSNKVYYKVSSCENLQQHSCSITIPPSNGP